MYRLYMNNMGGILGDGMSLYETILSFDLLVSIAKAFSRNNSPCLVRYGTWEDFPMYLSAQWTHPTSRNQTNHDSCASRCVGKLESRIARAFDPSCQGKLFARSSHRLDDELLRLSRMSIASYCIVLQVLPSTVLSSVEGAYSSD